MGCVLKVVGWGLSALGWLTISLATLLLMVLSEWSDQGPPQSPLFSLTFLAGAGMWLAGYALSEGRKRVLVFLRPFHLNAANTFTVTLVGRYLRKQFRVVTLDDGNIPAPRVDLRDRALFAVAAIPLLLVMLFVLATFTPQPGEPQTSLSRLNLLVLCGVWGMLTSPIFRTLSAKTLKNRFSITTSDDLASARKRTMALAGFSLNVTMPQVTVFQSSDACWRPAVAEMVETSDVVVIDVSLATHNVCWELELLKSQPRRTFAVISSAAAGAMLEKYPGDGSAIRLRQLLLGTPVLQYPQQIAADRSFAHQLVQLLNASPATRPGGLAL